MDFSNTRISPTRELTDYSKVQSLIAAMKRRIPALNRPIPEGAYLHLGCGPNVLPGFINLDYLWKPGVDVCHDLASGVPARDGSIAGIFTEHCLEHLPLALTRSLLADCLRALRPGALIRIVVPDLEIYCRSYLEGLQGETTSQPNEKFVNDTGVNRPVAVFNELFYGPSHRFIYDFRAMAEVLQQAGFIDVTRCAIGIGKDPRLLVDDPKHQSESLYVEARKP